MPPTNMYVRAEDVELWNRFTALAARNRQSASALMMMLVEKYVSEQDDADQA